MKKILLLSTILLLGLTAAILPPAPPMPAPAAVQIPQAKEILTISNDIKGVVIDGIRWATRNVDMPGTFAKSPENTGMLFQWNRKKAWDTIDRDMSDWDRTTPEGTEWYAENDPCPDGWRVPTREELQSLNNSGSVWAIYNEVYGRLFGVVPNQIFLPAVRNRGERWGLLNEVAFSSSSYWSSNIQRDTEAACLRFHSVSVSVSWNRKGSALSVRCVAESENQ